VGTTLVVVGVYSAKGDPETKKLLIELVKYSSFPSSLMGANTEYINPKET